MRRSRPFLKGTDMFIKLTNIGTTKEMYVGTANLISFEPTINGLNSVIKMTNGEARAVVETCTVILGLTKRAASLAKAKASG